MFCTVSIWLNVSHICCACALQITSSHRLAGMRVVNVYDIDNKTYLIRFARWVHSIETLIDTRKQLIDFEKSKKVGGNLVG